MKAYEVKSTNLANHLFVFHMPTAYLINYADFAYTKNRFTPRTLFNSKTFITTLKYLIYIL